MKKLIYYVMIFSFMFFISCKEEEDDYTLNVDESNISLYVGESYLFNINEEVILTSSSEDIVMISETKITALKPGEITITIKLKSCETIHKDVFVTIIEKENVLDKVADKIVMEESEEYAVDVEKIFLLSSDEEIVSVNSKTIKGIKPGIAIITVYEEGNENNFKNISVEVIEKTYKLNTLTGYVCTYGSSNEEFLEGLKKYSGNYDLREETDSVRIIKNEFYMTRRKSMVLEIVDILEQVDFKITSSDDYRDHTFHSYKICFLFFGNSSLGKQITDVEICCDNIAFFLFRDGEDEYCFKGKLPEDFDVENFSEYTRLNWRASNSGDIEIGEVYNPVFLNEEYTLYTEDVDVVRIEGIQIIGIGFGVAKIKGETQQGTVIEFSVTVCLKKEFVFIPSIINLDVDEKYLLDHYTFMNIIAVTNDDEVVQIEGNYIIGLKEGETTVTVMSASDENVTMDVTVIVKDKS